MKQSVETGPKDKVFSEFAARNKDQDVPASQTDSAKAGAPVLKISAKDNGGQEFGQTRQNGM